MSYEWYTSESKVTDKGRHSKYCDMVINYGDLSATERAYFKTDRRHVLPKTCTSPKYVTFTGLITSANEVMFLPDFVCLSVCVCAR